VDYALTLVAALVLGVGFVLQQHAAEQTPKSHFLSLKLIGDLFRKRLWLAGIVAMIAGQILAAWSIGNLELSIVEPLLTTNLLFALVLAVPLSHQAVRVTEVGGAILLIAGEALLEVARSAQPIGQSFGSFAHWPAAALIAGVAFAAVQAGRQRHDSRRATLTGLGAGLVFGIQDALTRQTLQILQHHGLAGLLQSWSAYCLVATGAVGVLLMQYAFSAGPLHSSLPTIAAGEPVAGILLGIVVFGDRISLTPASLAMQAGGLAALVVGVILVARAPALSAVRKAVTEPVHLPHPHFREHRPYSTPPNGNAAPALSNGHSTLPPDTAPHNGHSDPPAQDQDDHPAARISAPPPVPRPPDAPGPSTAPDTRHENGGSALPPGSAPATATPPLAATAPSATATRPSAPPTGQPSSPTGQPIPPTGQPAPPTGQSVPPIGPVGPVGSIGPIEPGGPVSHIGPPGLMAPAQPPMAVPPDSPLGPL
jgi:drug/metabolite transporter (DMT)-like permease